MTKDDRRKACVAGLLSIVRVHEVPMSTEISFEDLYRELEETVRKLETGDPSTGSGQALPLAEALALFERGTTLAEQCNTLLDGAELRVRQLTTRPDGRLEAEPFEAGQGE
jgi:exodeoxyribonuclease VII small subunit